MHGVIAGFLENWTSFFSNHAAVRTLIGFFHIGGLVIGGGCAISADRMTLRAARRARSSAEHSSDCFVQPGGCYFEWSAAVRGGCGKLSSLRLLLDEDGVSGRFAG
jgi:hypothetical protein